MIIEEGVVKKGKEIGFEREEIGEVILKSESGRKNKEIEDIEEKIKRKREIDIGIGSEEDKLGGDVISEVIGDIELRSDRIGIIEIGKRKEVKIEGILGNEEK